MSRGAALLVLLAVLTAPFVVAGEETTCAVRYLSSDHVYLDAGSNAGLSVGMTVRVVRDGEAIAELEVVFTAGHSASCRIVSKVKDIVVGDTVVYLSLIHI